MMYVKSPFTVKSGYRLYRLLKYTGLLVVLAGFFFLLWLGASCEKDDICVGSNTPLLIIRFYDKDNPETPKEVTLLRITGEGLADPVSTVNRVTVDSIAIPLRSFESSTTFSFISNSQDDGAGMETGNTDILHFSYQPYEVFVSRACGYVANYENLDMVIENDGDNWIDSYQVMNTSITDQKAAHVKLFH